MPGPTPYAPMAREPVAQEHSEFSRVVFGRFMLEPSRRQLFGDGRPIELGGLAFDVLVALVQAKGDVVSKDELLSRVWRGRVVEDNSIEVQIFAVRKALGPDRDLIRTVSRRGYQFIGEIQGIAPAVAVSARRSLTNLPAPVTALIGRDDAIREV